MPQIYALFFLEKKMATNKIQDGKVIAVVATAAVTSGDLIAVGKLVGVALNTAAIGETYQLDTEGVYEVPKTSALAFALGASVFAKGDGGVNATNTNPLAGHAVVAAANPSDTVKIRLQSGA